MMEIKNDISIIINQDPAEGYVVYVEQLPHIHASGITVAEANARLIAKLKRLEEDNYSRYNIVEYKYGSSAFKN